MTSTVLPQQRLLLELIAMSGDIAVLNIAKHSILWRTLDECRTKGWLKVSRISDGVHKASLLDPGRSIVREEFETGLGI
ncbi:hypothetical protein [Rhodospirillum sp. A1_3_36]|uniref:hypothetical protein n=1 Tax=Rhodospirillum sp. A1_3_36 TaxID=3391666 RepID=UPI0039A5CE80